MAKQPKVKIGVSGSAIDSKSVQAMMHRLWASGAEPVFLSDPSTRDIGTDIRSFDAFVIMGSDDDIDPREYGETTNHPETKINPDHSRALYENGLIEAALFYDVPLMGICAGMQRINIANHAKDGGSLHQHIPDVTGQNHWQNEPNYVAVQPVAILDGTHLSHMVDGASQMITLGHDQPNAQLINENAFHHQAIKEVRRGFIASAISDDGIVEAIEPDPNGPYANAKMIGVQWHPEFGASPTSAKLIDGITTQAQEHAQLRTSQLSGGYSAKLQESAANRNISPTIH
ncbi:MAG: gamma-glutamyl-gamma-aminobutyrate hydrolase family protein [Rickettsiales bacterium]|nr:gamma-glutamyl-gamma-aminobutyrate hydrolase family protein [Rickettsiales bacterium]